MHLEILTPDKTIFSGQIKSVTVPGTKDPFTVLENHASIISTLDKGDLGLETASGVFMLYVIGEGMIEANQNKIMVLAEEITPKEL